MTFRVVLNGGDSDMVELELTELPESLVHEGTPYTLRRDERGVASRDVRGRFRFFWLWPKSEVDGATLAGHTTTERMVPRAPDTTKAPRPTS